MITPEDQSTNGPIRPLTAREKAGVVLGIGEVAVGVAGIALATDIFMGWNTLLEILGASEQALDCITQPDQRVIATFLVMVFSCLPLFDGLKRFFPRDLESN